MNVPGYKLFHGESFFTDWMPRGGNGFIIRGQMISTSESPGNGITATVEVWTKNSEEEGDGSVLLESGTDALEIDNPSPEAHPIEEVVLQPSGSGVKEMVRLKIFPKASTGSAGDWMLLRVFPLVWYDGA